MDRLFLAGLVRELAMVVRGRRVRSVRIEPEGRGLSLALAGVPGPHELVLHLSPGMAGVFTRELAGDFGPASPREAKLRKLLTSSEITSAEVAELDRVVTIGLVETRLGGNLRRRALVFELVPVRTGAFVVDVDSARVVEALSTGTPRLRVGERYRSLDPPPHASPPARNTEELERRVRALGGGVDRATLLSATGWTPRLVKELLFRIAGGEALSPAFENLQRRLRRARPVLYLDPDEPGRSLLSPIELASETGMEPRVMESFNAAMTEAVRLSERAERSSGLRHRLDNRLSKRVRKLSSLKRKLEGESQSLPEPESLRRKGETLLAGMGRAERAGEARVRVPDPFHPEAAPVEIEIDPRLDLAGNAERMFRRSRKAERKKLELRKRLGELDQQLAYVEGLAVSLGDAEELEELESIRREMLEQGLDAAEEPSGRTRERQKRLPPRKFRTRRGSVVLVGRSARSNAELTFRVAEPDDFWFHAANMPGSHVVLKRVGPAGPEEDEILEAAGYAAYFSKGRRDSHVEVMVTERKNVKSIKGAPPGLVKVERMRTVRVPPTPPPAEESGDEL